MVRIGIVAASLAVFVSTYVPTSLAVPVVFQGGDVGATPGSPTPNADAAAALYDAAAAALGTAHLIDFESAPLGPFASLVVAPGVTLSGTGFTGGPTHAIGSGQARAGCPALCGFDTTAGGSRYVDVDGNIITFTFATGISAFGAYLTGVQLDGERVTFYDGSSVSVPIHDFGSGAQFFGFTDAGGSITRIDIDTRNTTTFLGDFIGIDDVRYTTQASPAAMPEPGSLALFGAALVVGGLVRRRRRSSATSGQRSRTP